MATEGTTGSDNTPEVIVAHNDAGNVGRAEQAAVDSFKEFEAKMAAEASSAENKVEEKPAAKEDGTEKPEGEKPAKAGAEEGEAEGAEKPAVETGKSAAVAPKTDVKPADKGEKPVGKKSARERIGELTRARGEAEREVERLRRENEELRAGKKSAESVAQDENGELKEPDPKDFEYGELDPKYTKAVREYDKAVLRQEFEAKSAREAAALDAQEREDAFQEQVDALDEEVGDYVEVVVKGAQDKTWACSVEMNELIRGSDVGARIAYHLAKNPEESVKVAKMSPLGQAAWFGRKEAELATAPPSKEDKSGKPAAKVSQADPPATVTRAANGKFQANPATTDFAQFEKQYGHLLPPTGGF